MLKVIELAFCCYAVTDMPRARAFYEGVLNLKPTTISDTPGGKWVEYEFGPYALAIGSAPGWKPSPDGCTAALEVEDFDAAKYLSDSALIALGDVSEYGAGPQARELGRRFTVTELVPRATASPS